MISAWTMQNELCIIGINPGPSRFCDPDTIVLLSVVLVPKVLFGDQFLGEKTTYCKVKAHRRNASALCAPLHADGCRRLGWKVHVTRNDGEDKDLWLRETMNWRNWVLLGDCIKYGILVENRLKPLS